MRKRGLPIGLLIGLVLAVAAGLRTDTGQGYSDPIMLPRGAPATVVRSQRTLELRLIHQKTGRPQHYRWSLSVPKDGAVELECHEWLFIELYGRALPGIPKNSFRRVIPLDVAEEGVAEPYRFTIAWHSDK